MPGRNIYKEYVPDSYYHIYNRGINKQPVFLDDQDFVVFLGLLKRYLGNTTEKNINRISQPNYREQVELLAFCLMKNHFHLFIYQHTNLAIKDLMKSLTVAYGMYFNKRYKRVGPVFQQRYRAVRIVNDGQLLHITRYIHMNPHIYKTYAWSSLPYYTSQRQADWIQPKRILDLFEGDDYLDFLNEYANRRDELDALKKELANA